jgi:hypothetical protein
LTCGFSGPYPRVRVTSSKVACNYLCLRECLARSILSVFSTASDPLTGDILGRTGVPGAWAPRSTQMRPGSPNDRTGTYRVRSANANSP